jgi:pilus assembly protein Flp/PilA
MQNTIALVRGLVKKDEGQDLVEYALLVVLIAAVALGAVTTLGQTIHNTFWVLIVQKF